MNVGVFDAVGLDAVFFDALNGAFCDGCVLDSIDLDGVLFYADNLVVRYSIFLYARDRIVVDICNGGGGGQCLECQTKSENGGEGAGDLLHCGNLSLLAEFCELLLQLPGIFHVVLCVFRDSRGVGVAGCQADSRRQQ